MKIKVCSRCKSTSMVGKINFPDQWAGQPSLWTPSTSDATLGVLAAGYGAGGLAGSARNLTQWARNPILYEKGQTTLTDAAFNTVSGMSTIERGAAISWADALNIFSGNWAATWGTGPTPGASLFLLGGGTSMALFGGSNNCECK